MRRPNPTTGKPRVRGEVREDGFVFWCYEKTLIWKNGFFHEKWHSPEAFEKKLANKRKVRANRRASEKRRMPVWLNEQQRNLIAKYYKTAKQLQKHTGVLYEVDHIVPLLGKSVSGLHVPWNLQIITKAHNMVKSNNYE